MVLKDNFFSFSQLCISAEHLLFEMHDFVNFLLSSWNEKMVLTLFLIIVSTKRGNWGSQARLNLKYVKLRLSTAQYLKIKLYNVHVHILP